MKRRSAVFVWALCVLPVLAQESVTDLKSAIDHLGHLDYPIRMSAARTVRRIPAAQAVPAFAKSADRRPGRHVTAELATLV